MYISVQSSRVEIVQYKKIIVMMLAIYFVTAIRLGRPLHLVSPSSLGLVPSLIRLLE